MKYEESVRNVEEVRHHLGCRIEALIDLQGRLKEDGAPLSMKDKRLIREVYVPRFYTLFGECIASFLMGREVLEDQLKFLMAEMVGFI